jgi:putative copper export protein
MLKATTWAFVFDKASAPGSIAMGGSQMPSKQIVFALVTFLHDLFTVVWVGGLITLGLIVLPSARAVLGMGSETKKLMNTIQKRLSPLIYVSILGLIVTGLLLSRRSPAFQGLFGFGSAYATVLSVKHVLVVLMVGIALYRRLVLGRKSSPSSPRQEKLKVGLLLVNVVLGIAVLLLSGFSVALGAVPPV